MISEFLMLHDITPRCIVHVGANIAQEMGEYVALNPERIVWIEADENLHPRILAQIPPGPIKQDVVSALVSDQDGVPIGFRVANNDSQSSSIFEMADTHKSEWPGIDETGEVREILSTRLDTLLRSVGVASADVMVLDIQGAELLALKGAGSYLDTAQHIQIEVATETLYTGGATFDELDALLVGAGFHRHSPLISWYTDLIYSRMKPPVVAEAHFDIIRHNHVAGWVYAEGEPGVVFDLVSGGVPVKKITCNEYRADLQRIGEGKIAFNVDVALRVGDHIQAVHSRTGAVLAKGLVPAAS